MQYERRGDGRSGGKWSLGRANFPSLSSRRSSLDQVLQSTDLPLTLLPTGAVFFQKSHSRVS